MKGKGGSHGKRIDFSITLKTRVLRKKALTDFELLALYAGHFGFDQKGPEEIQWSWWTPSYQEGHLEEVLKILKDPVVFSSVVESFSRGR